jgi:cytochrome c oxidase subunit 2
VRPLYSVVVVAGLLVTGACGGSGGAASPEGTLSAAGERGREIANANGCAACHGANGQGGAGPTWVGLAGSDVELADGTVIVADDAYLTRAIADPGADLLAGYSLRMPDNQLTDAEIADVVAYIRDLSPPPGEP